MAAAAVTTTTTAPVAVLPRQTSESPSNKWWVSRAFLQMMLDVSLLILAWLPTVVLNLLKVRPSLQPISCTDDSLYSPHRNSTVPMAAAMTLCVGLNVFQVLAVEVWHSVRQEQTRVGLVDSWCSPSCGARVANRVYQVLLMLAFGSAAVEMLTEGTKLIVGRPRPHFWAVCKPVTLQVCQNMQLRRAVAVQELGCRSPNELVDDARKSFPSGHSSQSAFWMLAASLYLQKRLPDQHAPSLLLKPLVQLVWCALALGVALSRIADHKHHPWDVVAGCLLGGGVAFLLFSCCSVLRNLNRIPSNHLRASSSQQFTPHPHPRYAGETGVIPLLTSSRCHPPATVAARIRPTAADGHALRAPTVTTTTTRTVPHSHSHSSSFPSTCPKKSYS